MEILIVSIVACGAGIAGFVSGLFYRKVIEKKIRDSYTTYLEELSENGKRKEFDPHKAFNEAWDEMVEKTYKDISEKINNENPRKNQ